MTKYKFVCKMEKQKQKLYKVGREKKMSKEMKATITILIIILVAFGVLFAVYHHFEGTKPMEPKITTTGTIVPDANSGFDDLINEVIDEKTEEIDEKENSQNTQTTSNTSSSFTQETEDDTDSTPREKKAIELVKKEWEKEYGSLADVSFNNVGIQSDGKYRVSVNDATTTQVLQFYIVDVDTGVVKER